MHLTFLRLRAHKFIYEQHFFLSNYEDILESSKVIKKYLKVASHVYINEPSRIGTKPGLLIRNASQRLCKSVKTLFYSWNRFSKPFYERFSQIQSFTYYTNDNTLKIRRQFGNQFSLHFFNQIFCYPKLQAIILHSASVESMRAIYRQPRIRKVTLRCSLQQFLESFDLINSFSQRNIKFQFQFISDTMPTSIFLPHSYSQIFQNTENISLELPENNPPNCVLPVFTTQINNFCCLKEFSLECTIDHILEFPDLRTFQTLFSLESFSLKVNVHSFVPHEIFDEICLP